MPTAHLVEANGATIPAIGLGTFRLEGEACVEAVSFALRSGYRHIDTAKMYGNEEAVGAGMRASGVPRDEVFVTTKVWWEDIAPGDLRALGRGEPRSGSGSIEVDLLLIHWPNAAVPLGDSIGRALQREAPRPRPPYRRLELPVRHAATRRSRSRASRSSRTRSSTTAVSTRARSWRPAGRHGIALTSYCPLGRGRRRSSDPSVAAIAAAPRQDAGAGHAALARAAAGRGRDPEIRHAEAHRREPRRSSTSRSTR